MDKIVNMNAMEGEPMDSIFSGPPTLSQNSISSIFSAVWLLTPLIVYPSLWLFKFIMFFVRPIVYIAHTLALPFIRVAQGLWATIMLPFAIVAKFQAILTFFSIACLIGAFTGICLYGSYSFTSKLFGLEDPVIKQGKITRTSKQDSVRSVAEYRASRKQKKRSDKQIQSPRDERMFRDMMSSTASDKAAYSGGRGDSTGMHGGIPLLTQTILEEESSSSFG